MSLAAAQPGANLPVVAGSVGLPEVHKKILEAVSSVAATTLAAVTPKSASTVSKLAAVTPAPEIVGTTPTANHQSMMLARATDYFLAWNAHDKNVIQALHADSSRLTDWNGSYGPTNVDVAEGIAAIWADVPSISIELETIFTQGEGDSLTCVANIKVKMADKDTLDVVDVIRFNSAGLVVAIDAYLAAPISR